MISASLRSPNDVAGLIEDSVLHCSAYFNKGPLRKILDLIVQNELRQRFVLIYIYILQNTVLKFEHLVFTSSVSL